MYSGTTFKPLRYFDSWFGTHQKIDRVARRHLAGLLSGRDHYFPTAQQINRFEGLDGPDGIKRKRPSADEPWHFYDPTDPKDMKLIRIIEGHYRTLVDCLRHGDHTRAAFEAAWLAHAIIDGLTPAHHYPYEAELAKLRSGEGIETRDSLKEKVLMHGGTVREQVHNNWKMYGDRGLLATHFAFEWGVAVMISPLRLKLARPSVAEQEAVRAGGIAELFRDRAAKIAALNMYEQFYKSGWTPYLAKQARRQLVPLIVNAVTLTWYSAVLEAQAKTKLKAKTRPASR